MATCKWRGDAPAVAQINTVMPASVTIGNIFTLTMNGKTVTFTATAATVANVTAGLAAAVAASTIAEFQEVTATDNTTTLTLTANTAGVPFTQTSSSADGSGSAGHSLNTSTTTANSGPNNWDVAANWSGAAVPVDGDDVYIENSSVDILYGISQSSIDLLTLNIAASFTGKLGLPTINESGGYYEYRTRYLTLTADTVNVGYGEGSGSGRILLSLGANATVLVVTTTGSPIESAVPALVVAGSASTYTLTVLGGSVGIATEVGQAAVLDVVTISGTGNITLGSGCTLTTVTLDAGTLTTNSNVTTINVVDGTATIQAGTVGTLNQDGGVVDYRSTGTMTSAKVGTGATLDFTQDPRARTVSACTLEATGTITDTYKSVTWTTGIDLIRCSLAEVTLDLGTHVTITPSAV